jgi:predicted lipoprotein with Yx(FWY)xxD motif
MNRKTSSRILVAIIVLLITAATVACASNPAGSPAPSTPVLTPPPTSTPSAAPSPSPTPTQSPTPTPTATTPPTSTATPSGAYTISIWNSNNLGTYLVDANGMALYFFAKDTVGKSTATVAVIANWPPFYVSAISVPSSLNASDFAAITRDDGKKIIMYKGWPLYYYIGDKKAGDTNGQGIVGAWFVVNPLSFPPTPFPTPPAASSPAGSPTATTSPTSIPSAPPPQTPTSYTLNQPVTVGSTATWTVLAAKSLGNTLPATMSRTGKARTTTGKFVQVDFALDNKGDRIYNTGSIIPTIVDSKNGEFKPMDGYYDYVQQGQDFLNVDLLPTRPKSFIIIYEVPADATGLRLKVSDFSINGSNTALISLGL